MSECAVRRSLTIELRAATQTAHQALDSQAILVELSSGDIAPDRYLVVLKAFERVWCNLEPAAWAVLQARIPAIASFEDQRCGVLTADILALTGASPGGKPAAVPAISSAPEAAGAVYVLEGARLGGLLIADRLLKAGRPLGTPGYRFFGGARHGVADRWRRLRAAIDGQAWSDRDVAAAGKTALATFEAVSEALCEEASNVR